MLPLLAQDPFHPLRLAHVEPPHIHGTASYSGGDRAFEPVLTNPQMELRAGQPKPPRGFRLVSATFLHDFRTRGAFDDAEISGVVTR